MSWIPLRELAPEGVNPGYVSGTTELKVGAAGADKPGACPVADVPGLFYIHWHERTGAEADWDGCAVSGREAHIRSRIALVCGGGL